MSCDTKLSDFRKIIIPCYIVKVNGVKKAVINGKLLAQIVIFIIIIRTDVLSCENEIFDHFR